MDLRSRGIAAAIGAILFFSGFSALIYQVVWQRMLTVYYGVGAVSAAVIVCIFMAGLGIGSLVGGYFAECIRKPLMLYVAVEVLIGAFGMASLPFLDALGARTAGLDLVTASAFIFAFLAMPTVLMGITLPAIIKVFAGRWPDLLQNLSFFYFVNTLGAAVGAVFTSYVAISFWGLEGATAVAAGINLLLAAATATLSQRVYAAGAEHGDGAAEVTRQAVGGLGGLAYPIVFVTGFLAIGYQITWFRMIGVLLKDTSYSFSTTLGVYLLGIALGSLWINSGPRLLRVLSRQHAFFLVNVLIAMSSYLTMAGFHHFAGQPALGAIVGQSWTYSAIPYLPPADSAVETARMWRSLAIVFGWPAVFLLVPTFFMGASFPLVASLMSRNPRQPARDVSVAYALTILGNTLGSVVTAFILLPRFGTERVMFGFALIGLLFIVGVGRLGERRVPAAARWTGFGAAALCCLLVLPAPGDLYKTMHRIHLQPGTETYFEEGLEGVVATFRQDKGDRLLNFINGNGNGTRPNAGYFSETFLTLGYSTRPARVLVIGFGAGSITEGLLLDPRVARITMVEIVGAAIHNHRKIPMLRSILDDPRVEVVNDDARRYLLRSQEEFDVILMDPLRPTSSYSNNVYSKDFFELVKRRLAPEGLLIVSTIRSPVLTRTVADSFAAANYYGCQNFTFFVASQSSLRHDAAISQSLARAHPTLSNQILEEIRCGYLERAEILRITQALPVNRNHDPVSEYYLGAWSRGYMYWSEEPRKAVAP